MHSHLGKLVYRTIQNWRQELVLEFMQELEESQYYSEDKWAET